ncbi:MAG: hypothetical protein ACRD6X_07555 [Pyrinomonadaceae bacterium]
MPDTTIPKQNGNFTDNDSSNFISGKVVIPEGGSITYTGTQASLPATPVLAATLT